MGLRDTVQSTMHNLFKKDKDKPPSAPTPSNPPPITTSAWSPPQELPGSSPVSPQPGMNSRQPSWGTSTQASSPDSPHHHPNWSPSQASSSTAPSQPQGHQHNYAAASYHQQQATPSNNDNAITRPAQYPVQLPHHAEWVFQQLLNQQRVTQQAAADQPSRIQMGDTINGNGQKHGGDNFAGGKFVFR